MAPIAPLADPECERDLIATALRGGEACYQVLANLSAADFTVPGLGEILLAMAELVARGREVSYPAVRLALSEELRATLDQVVEQGFCAPSMATEWAERVRRLSRLRSLRDACYEIATTLSQGDPGEDYLRQAADKLTSVLAGQRTDEIVIPPERWPEELYREVCRRRDESEQYAYLRWGLPEIERAVALQPKDLLIVAAETGRGKTNWALGLAFAVAVRGRYPTLYVNSEMGWEQVAMRLGAMGTGVSAHRMRTGMLSEHDLALLDRFRREAANNRLWLTDAAGALTPDRVIVLAKQYRAAGMRLLIVDYVQRLFGGRRSPEEREWEVLLSVVERLKTLAQELGIIVVVVAQMSPEGYLARARQMGQEADALITLHHADDLPPEEQKRLPGGATHVARVRKSRHGPDRQEIALRFDPDWLRFEEVGRLRGRV